MTGLGTSRTGGASVGLGKSLVGGGGSVLTTGGGILIGSIILGILREPSLHNNL